MGIVAKSGTITFLGKQGAISASAYIDYNNKVREWTKDISETFSVTDDFARALSMVRAFTEDLIVSEVPSMGPGTSFADTISITEGLARGHGRELADTVNVWNMETWTYVFGKNISETLVWEDTSVVTQIASSQLFTETLTATDSDFSYVIQPGISITDDTFDVVDSISFGFGKGVADSLMTTEGFRTTGYNRWTTTNGYNVTTTNFDTYLSNISFSNFRAGGRAVAGITTGKYYFEISAFGPASGTPPKWKEFGLGSIAALSGTKLGADNQSICVIGGPDPQGTRNQIRINNVEVGVGPLPFYPQSWDDNGWLGVAVDMDAKKIWFRQYGGAFYWNGDAGGAQDPAIGLGGIDISALPSKLYLLGMSVGFGTGILLNPSGQSIGTRPAGFGILPYTDV